MKPALQETLIQYAKDLAAAEDRGEVIELMEDVDEYVDRLMEEA